jgi:hypothetical protein
MRRSVWNNSGRIVERFAENATVICPACVRLSVKNAAWLFHCSNSGMYQPAATGNGTKRTPASASFASDESVF